VIRGLGNDSVYFLDSSNTVLMRLREDLKVTPEKVAQVAEMLKADKENVELEEL
jgi:hypothetical protein